MKTLIKFAVATVLALSAAVPAFAGEENTLLERNTYNFTADARPIVHHQQNADVRAHRGTEAQAFAPAQTMAPEVRDFGISGY